MTKNSNLEKIINELSASLSEDSREAMMRRINTERLIKLVLEDLVEKHKAESIRIIPDNRLTIQEAADYLVQVDDYDLRLILMDTVDGKVKLTAKLLQEWVTLLEANASTAILIVVGISDDLSSIPFTMKRLKSIVNSEEQITKIAQIAKPFEDVIADVIHHQTKGWKIPKLDPNQPSTSQRDLYAIFSEKIIRAIDDEANRRYRTEERLKAAKNFPAEQEKRAILRILREALDGAASKELEKRLTSLPRRGEK
jgi:hypothetical protein